MDLTNCSGTFMVAIRMIGGMALIASEGLTTRDAVILYPYVGALVATAIALKMLPPTTFRQRVWAAISVFMCSSLMLYAFIVGVANPAALAVTGVGGHAWRLAFLAAIGSRCPRCLPI
jgi:hypothetical protein